METVTYLDTHVAAWLHAGRTDLLPDEVRTWLESSDLLVSPMVVLELQYLYEIGRVSEPARSVVEGLGSALGLRVCELDFAKVVEAALSQSWTRDPFDRLIVAQASLRDAPLLTKDSQMARHYRGALWR